ncbi:MAG TPA: PAS domain S-box protein [Thermoanaerobaculia bacterium]|nr:PAS domain S-box protein [Thermoanaerobaculia bacterium]
MFSLIQRLASRPGAATPAEPSRGRDERLRAAFAAAPVGLGVADFDGHWVLFNDAAATVLGYTREELAGVSLHEITHADDRVRELDFIRRMAAGDVKRYQIEKRIIDKQGNARGVVVTAAVVRGRTGTGDGIVYVLEPRQPRVESGRTADGLSHAILDRLPDTAVVRCDAQGTILGWNHGAERMFGFKRDEIVGRNRRELYRDRSSDAANDHLRVAAERRHFEAEDWRVAKDGRELWLRVSLTPFAPDGAVRGFVEVLHEAATYGDAIAARLREELQTERNAAATMNNIVEKLKARLQNEVTRSAELEQELRALRERVEQAEAAAAPEWTPFGDRGPLDVIAEAAGAGRSGMLLFASESKQVSVFLEDGCLVACASNDVTRSLGEQLVSSGAITDAQRTKALQMVEATNVSLGRALVILGALREESIARALNEKIDRELCELESWLTGRWTFAARQTPRNKPVRIALHLADLRQFASAEYVASRNGTRYHRPSCTSMLRVKGNERMPVVSPLAGAERGLSPCRLCVVSV